MNFNSKVSLWLTHFFKRYGKLILIILTIWVIVIIINNYLKKNKKTESALSNAYNPDKAVMDSTSLGVSKKYRETVKETIDTYFKNCNSENYQEAFDMLSDECRSFLYDNDVSVFEDYAKDFYTGNKKYYLQNYSNLTDKYIYDLYVVDDIESTGATNGYDEKKEKIVVIKNGDEYKISNQGYVGNEKFDNVSSEAEEIKAVVNSKDISYQKEAYNLTITNKTDKYLLISDGTYTNEVTLNLGDQKRNATNTQNATFLLGPNETKNFVFIFNKFADDGKDPTEINFNLVRLYENYNTQLSADDADSTFSFNISLEN